METTGCCSSGSSAHLWNLWSLMAVRFRDSNLAWWQQRTDLIACSTHPVRGARVPFDFQAMSFSICVNCREDGPLPTRFALSNRSKRTISPEGVRMVTNEYLIVPDDENDILHDLHVHAAQTGSASRAFPTLVVSVLLSRRAGAR
eukprot:4328850-Prymnesium_polylepis.2